MALLFQNNCSTTLATAINATQVAIPLLPGSGDRFPSAGGDDTYYVTIMDASGTYEILLVRSKVAPDTLSASRGMDGTTPRSWPQGVRIELRTTRAVLQNFLQKTGGIMSGNIDMAGNSILRAVFGGVEGTELPVIRTGKILPIDGNEDAKFDLRAGGLFPLIGNSVVLTRNQLRRLIFMFNGPDSDVVEPFTLCDGTRGTPDLRDRFIIASGPRHPAGSRLPSTVPAEAQRTNLRGDHNHGGRTGSRVLTVAQLPSHQHQIVGIETSANNTGTRYAATSGTPVADRNTSSVGGNEAHDHGIGNDGTVHDHAVPEPVYYALAFVMFSNASLQG